MKSTCLIIFAFLLSTYLHAQETETNEQDVKSNIIKINLSSLVFTNISLQYERKISNRSSVALNAHTRAFGTIPFKSSIKTSIDDPNVDLDKLKFGFWGITPEIRYYVGKQGALHGFYLGPFMSYNNYKADLPVTYNNDTRTGVFSGKLNAYTFGLQLGAQWQLSKALYLDWWILGPNYGSASGDLNLNTTLSASEQQDLADELEKLKNDVPLKTIKGYSVSANGATINAKGPWAGIRAMGINLGFTF